MKAYVVCMDPTYVRNAETINTLALNDDEFNDFDWMGCETERMWHEMNPIPFIDIVEAPDEEEACKIVAERKRYDARTLYAFETKPNK